MNILLELTNDLGYLAMFVFSWLVFLGFPLPNEISAALAGAITEWKQYNPWIAFFSTYSGIVTCGAFGYWIGRGVGPNFIQKRTRKKSFALLKKSQEWLHQYGAISISFSYFIPGVRWFMPYIVGASRIPFGRFVVFAFPSAFIWCLLFFNIGRYFPSTFKVMIENLSLVLAGVSVVVLAILILFSIYKKKKHRKQTLLKEDER
jgi:membrane-associated protein